MKKLLWSIPVLGLFLLFLTGCTTSKSYTYSVETGDKVKVQLDTSDGYDLSSELPFKISKDDKILSEGTFIKESYYEEYVNAAKTDPKATVIDEESKGSIEYVFYSFDDSEWNYVIKIKDSNTAILLGNPHSQKEAEECFKLLTFELDN